MRRCDVMKNDIPLLVSQQGHFAILQNSRSAVFLKISTFQTLRYWVQPNGRITLADLLLFFSQAMSFNSEGQLWQNQRKAARCALIVRELKKSKVRNLKRVRVWGEEFTRQSSFLSSLAPLPSFHGIYGVWPLSKKGDLRLTYTFDTHWQTTNPSKI